MGEGEGKIRVSGWRLLGFMETCGDTVRNGWLEKMRTADTIRV